MITHMVALILLLAFVTGICFAMFPLAIPMGLLIMGPLVVVMGAWAMYAVVRRHPR